MFVFNMFVTYSQYFVSLKLKLYFPRSCVKAGSREQICEVSPWRLSLRIALFVLQKENIAEEDEDTYLLELRLAALESAARAKK